MGGGVNVGGLWHLTRVKGWAQHAGRIQARGRHESRLVPRIHVGMRTGSVRRRRLGRAAQGNPNARQC